jgi:hypothetical protein
MALKGDFWMRRSSVLAAPVRVVTAALLMLASAIGMAGEGLAKGGGRHPVVQPLDIIVSSQAIERFKINEPERRRFGKLEFRGGLVLTSSAPAFGGWSGLSMSGDGRHLLSISDEGSWLAADLDYKGRAPVGVTHARLGPILALKGRVLDKKRDLDAEGLSLYQGDVQQGAVLISFERNHRIGVFPVVAGNVEAPIRYLRLPPEARRMKSNKGIEAVTVLKGRRNVGTIIAFAERFPGDPSRHQGWIWQDGQPRGLKLIDIAGFDITDAAALDNGDLLLLERRFRWTEGVKMRIRHFAAETIYAGATLKGEVLLEADMGYEIDNMEGLAVHKDSSGETVLSLISDNNFNPILQRTILLQFALRDDRQAAGRHPPFR